MACTLPQNAGCSKSGPKAAPYTTQMNEFIPGPPKYQNDSPYIEDPRFGISSILFGTLEIHSFTSEQLHRILTTSPGLHKRPTAVLFVESLMGQAW